MCGITAYFGPPYAGLEQHVRSCTNALRHRGPDEFGLQSGEGWVLGHRRLTIVGGQRSGRQPISDGPRHLTFNGEIHNYLELAESLQAIGVTGDFSSDSEVLFACLKTWGLASLSKLRGFWAFVYVDESSGVAWAARDRFGQKPLVYGKSQKGISLASEVDGLVLPNRPSVRRTALTQFVLNAQYPSAPATFYEGIQQVCPGHVLLLDLATGSIRESQFYQPSLVHHAHKQLTEKEATSKFAELLKKSVSVRSRADVPLGLLLSAGKDSGTLATLLQVPALSFSNQTPTDELHQVQNWYGNSHEVHAVRLPSGDALEASYIDLHKTLDAPLASASLLAQHALFASAKARQLRVLVSGQGADELLGGYHYYSLLQDSRLGRWRSAWRLYGSLGEFHRIRAARKMLRGLEQQLGPLPPQDQPHTVQARRQADLAGQQLQTMLWYEDRIAMRHSVEVRYPFLDVELVDFCLSLPESFFVSGLQRKRLLDLAFGQQWPKALRNERKKRGLPSAENRLLAQHPIFFDAGIKHLEDALSLKLRLQRDQLRLPNQQLRALEKPLWRLAAAGHWFSGKTLA